MYIVVFYILLLFIFFEYKIFLLYLLLVRSFIYPDGEGVECSGSALTKVDRALVPSPLTPGGRGGVQLTSALTKVVSCSY